MAVLFSQVSSIFLKPVYFQVVDNKMLVVNSNRASDNLFQPLIDVIASLAKQAASEPDTTPDPAYFGFNDELDSRNNNDNVYNGL
jgi:hypothetical protein